MAGLKFRVLLDSVESTEVFREILIDDSNTFEHFYNAILDAFQLENNQMASYYISDKNWDKGEEITLMSMAFDSGEMQNAPKEMNSLMLKERVYDPQQRFLLVYDFLAMWIFLIELYEITDKGVERPQLLLEVGQIPDRLLEEGPNSLENLQFDTDFDPDKLNLENGENAFSNGEFDNIDDLDI